MAKPHSFESRTLSRYRDPPRRYSRVLRSAVVLMLVLLGILYLQNHAREAQSEAALETAATPPAATRFETLRVDGEFVPRQMSTLAAPPLRLTWPAVDGVRYRVRVVDESAAVVWESPWLEDAGVELPEGIRARMASGRFGWQVELDGVAEAAGATADGVRRRLPFHEMEIVPDAS